MALPRKNYIDLEEASHEHAVSKATIKFWVSQGRFEQFNKMNGEPLLGHDEILALAEKLNPSGGRPAGHSPQKVVTLRQRERDLPRETPKLPPLPQLGEFSRKVLEDAVGEIHAPELREDRNVRGWQLHDGGYGHPAKQTLRSGGTRTPCPWTGSLSSGFL